MGARLAELTVDASGAPMVGQSSLLVVHPRRLLQAGPVTRAAVAFVLVVALGGLLLWWSRPLIERATSSSTTRPLYSLAHGIAAHGIVVFGTVYAANQLGPLEIGGRSAASIGLAAGVILLLVVAAFGFTVVGSIVVEYGMSRGPWAGLIVGAVIAAFSASLPPMYGGLLWLFLVSMGIGGPVRRWFHASSDAEI